ncbi:hypothetical protein [Pseudooceanicola aestuarii]|uniref:hypothetical protein n=1 Tax=Pseudooceanicola aestuarii TaxID=2697319 RepID=UPI00195447EC|nr:hypothetical protein [Pseudooceanicola aestuarii]
MADLTQLDKAMNKGDSSDFVKLKGQGDDQKFKLGFSTLTGAIKYRNLSADQKAAQNATVRNTVVDKMTGGARDLVRLSVLAARQDLHNTYRSAGGDTALDAFLGGVGGDGALGALEDKVMAKVARYLDGKGDFEAGKRITVGDIDVRLNKVEAYINRSIAKFAGNDMRPAFVRGADDNCFAKFGLRFPDLRATASTLQILEPVPRLLDLLDKADDTQFLRPTKKGLDPIKFHTAETAKQIAGDGTNKVRDKLGSPLFEVVAVLTGAAEKLVKTPVNQIVAAAQNWDAYEASAFRDTFPAGEDVTRFADLASDRMKDRVDARCVELFGSAVLEDFYELPDDAFNALSSNFTVGNFKTLLSEIEVMSQEVIQEIYETEIEPLLRDVATPPIPPQAPIGQSAVQQLIQMFEAAT